jgi:hypothetical protein
VDAAAWAAARLPLLAVYREPQKWSALWLLALVVLGAEAVGAVRVRELAHGARVVVAPALAYLLALSVVLPAGLGIAEGWAVAVRPSGYPADWAAAAAYLRANVPPDDVVVVLPWHAYERLDIAAGRLVSNPAVVVFPGRLLVPNNAEIPGRLTDDAATLDIASASVGGEAGCELADAVRAHGARWAVVEPADGAEADRGRLAACGFTVVQGRPGQVEVLRAA